MIGSCMLDKARLVGVCLISRDLNTMDFKLLLWISSTEHVVKL